MSDMDDVEGFARANARRRLIRIAIVLLVFSSPFLYLSYSCVKEKHERDVRRENNRKALELTDAERKELEARVPSARKLVTEARAAWAKAVTHETLAKVVPGDGRCDLSRETGYVARYKIDQALPPPYETDLATVADVEKRLANGSANRDDRGRLDRLADEPVYFIITDKESDPIVTTGAVGISSFIPGYISGHAFVYSPQQRAIVCTMTVDVQNSESVQFNFQYMEGNYLDKEYKMREAGKAQLWRDLEQRISQALKTEMHVVAP